ncbi:MAG TPA: nucleoside hydrolase, partial [Phycisphaerae bacterium]|nr:nucleoside hydrolase [Phycisphaerae bacterium]
MSGGKAALLIVLVLVLPLAAHEVEDSPAVVIDSDMGIDDAVTLALALQCPHIRVSAVVACEGVAGRETGAQMLGRMLDEFNRTDVPLYAAADRRGPGEAAPHGAPAFRHFAEATIAQALRGAPREPLPFTPKAYLDGRGGRTVVLALGPLTNIAAALKEEAVRKGIARIMVQGPPDASRNWNIACDPEAFAAVRESGVPLQFVESGPAAAKPEEWRRSGPRGQRTSIGEGFVARLFADAAFREHYTQGAFAAFTDELLLIACVDDDL